MSRFLLRFHQTKAVARIASVALRPCVRMSVLCQHAVSRPLSLGVRRSSTVNGPAASADPSAATATTASSSAAPRTERSTEEWSALAEWREKVDALHARGAVAEADGLFNAVRDHADNADWRHHVGSRARVLLGAPPPPGVPVAPKPAPETVVQRPRLPPGKIVHKAVQGLREYWSASDARGGEIQPTIHVYNDLCTEHTVPSALFPPFLADWLACSLPFVCDV